MNTNLAILAGFLVAFLVGQGIITAGWVREARTTLRRWWSR